nr:MAG TPA: hypothetical protein [Caudoviricetes sp.]
MTAFLLDSLASYCVTITPYLQGEVFYLVFLCPRIF